MYNLFSKKQRVVRKGVNFLGPYKHVICKGILENPHNDKVLEKYYWAAKYFDMALKDYPPDHLDYTVVNIYDNYVAYGRDEWPRWRAADVSDDAGSEI